MKFQNPRIKEEYPTSCSSKTAVPHKISAGLEILRKFFLAWKFLQFEEHLFDIFLYFVIIYENNKLQIDCNCLQFSYNPFIVVYDR